MKKRKTNKWIKKNWIGLSILAALIVLIVLVIFIFPDIILQFQLPGVGLTEFDRLEPGNCTVALDKRNICMGDTVTGLITDGRNANCIVGLNFNSGAWTNIGVVKTNNAGRYSHSQTVINAGEYIFAAICTDNNITCRTNNAYLTVRPCPSPGDSDGDGFSDDEEDAAGTDPDDPYDFPDEDWEDNGITYTCGQGNDVDNCEGTCPTGYWCIDIYFDEYRACVCLTSDGSDEVHPDWKPDGDYHNPMDEEVIETIGTYCADLGFNRHWDTHSEGNCIQAAINYCGGAYEYHWNAEKTWCCYKCVEPNCNIECTNAGYPYGGWYSGGVSCGDFEHYLPGSQCCCETLYTFCVDSCYADGFVNSIPFVDTGWDCAGWARNDCPSSFQSRDDGTCCCWNCV